MSGVYDFSAKSLSGDEVPLQRFAGKVAEARALCRGFDDAKAFCYRVLQDERMTGLPFMRAYLDDKPVAEGKAGADGHWRLAPTEPIEQGEHRLRVDRLTQDGKPSARLELKFERQKTEPGDNRRLHVVRGDNLWNIARAHYGEGFRYTMIFDANKDQIRDPNLIYPGQVFALPKVN